MIIFARFSHEAAIRLLLACGSRWLDLDAVESSHRSTPLHRLCEQSDKRQLLELFLKSGCHPDGVDKRGRTPFDLIHDAEMKSIFPSERTPTKLKCLCARLVAQQRLNIDCMGTSDSALRKFVVLHGYHAKE